MVPKGDPTFTPAFQMRKGRHRKGVHHAPGNTAREWQSWDMNLGSQTPDWRAEAPQRGRFFQLGDGAEAWWGQGEWRSQGQKQPGQWEQGPGLGGGAEQGREEEQHLRVTWGCSPHPSEPHSLPQEN